MPTTRPTILIVEDEAPVRAMLAAALRNDGFAVIEAPAGEMAMAVSRNYFGPIDLAIVDVSLPGMGGLDLANCLLPRRPGMKVLYISGLVDSVAVESLVRAAPQSVVRKPFTAGELLLRVREFLPREE